MELPKADEAVKYLGEVLDKNGPLYKLKTQSFVTHVCDVLRHGGIDDPNKLGA
ncbi:hypothetical protein SD435_12545 [Kosakonia cowanii]|uniref:hypothetical protein n=1 Tax=Kosakonia cowanii TaxID=208223 RepID=UPI0029C775DC|nr:hypothetical protein [Kosakonia cowanii]WPG23154.1 hypothetical protein SD435_12545 [Kosakonia cowanii]